ncbi:MAG TPA: RNA polymerase sigma factor [Nocardioides sp.]|nr:RNA polymerase sigma factor [Nocardioides sp.]
MTAVALSDESSGMPCPSTPTEHRSCRHGGCAQLCTDEGLAAAYAAHGPRALARARRIVVDPHLAEEAAQEAFTRAWRHCSRFDPAGGPLANWLLAITTNVSIDLVRARVSRPPVAAVEPGDEASDHRVGLDVVLLRDELRDALAQISENHRRAVLETIVLDRPYQDVAGELGINVATLRTRVHYALRRLRDVLTNRTCLVESAA